MRRGRHVTGHFSKCLGSKSRLRSRREVTCKVGESLTCSRAETSALGVIRHRWCGHGRCIVWRSSRCRHSRECAPSLLFAHHETRAVQIGLTPTSVVCAHIEALRCRLVSLDQPDERRVARALERDGPDRIVRAPGRRGAREKAPQETGGCAGCAVGLMVMVGLGSAALSMALFGPTFGTVIAVAVLLLVIVAGVGS